jgi:hypothetical protein
MNECRAEGKGQRHSQESRCNREYERCMIEEILVFLRRERAKENKTIARFRCGNEERENRYWTEGEKIRCRMCYEERERERERETRAHLE